MSTKDIFFRRFASLLACLLCIFPAAGFSEEVVENSAEHGAEGEHEHEHEWHPNFVAIFIGGASEERREGGIAFGVDYARRFNQKFSLGVLAERTLGDLDFWVFAAPFAYHTGSWKFYAGPGVEREDKGENEFLVRIGGEYIFEVGELEIAPQIDFDFVDGDRAFIIGVTIGKSF